MGSIYWLVKIRSDTRLVNWIIENYPGINYVTWNVTIPKELRTHNILSGRRTSMQFHQATVISFQDFDNPDVDVKFKLMNADLILDHKTENPGQHW